MDADIAIQVPAIYSENYIESLKEIIRSHAVDAIISLNDLELPVLSQAREELEALGAKVIVSDEEVIRITFDKWETVKFLEQSGLKTPRTYIDFEKAKQAIAAGELEFPLVLKPRWGSASIGIDFPETMRELELAYELQNLRLQRTILAKASESDIRRAIMIQEKLPGKEYGLDVLNDLEGKYVATFAREKLAMRSGETDKAASISDPRFNAIGEAIGKNLGHIGNLDADAFIKDGDIYILELNPRFGGGYPFTHEAGMNVPAALISWLKGGKGISEFDSFTPGLVFSKCDRLLRVGGMMNIKY